MRPVSRTAILSIAIAVMVFFNVFLSVIAFAVPVSDGFSEGMFVANEMLRRNIAEYLEDAEENLRTGDLRQFGIMVGRLKQVDPKNEKLIALYSIYLVSRGLIDHAKKELMVLENDNKYAHYAKAMILRDEGDLQRALATCMGAIEMDASHPFPHNILGGIHFDMKHFDLAIAAFQKAILLSPAFYPAYTNLGFAHLERNDLDNAAHAFERAVDFNLDTSSPHYGLALIHEKKGNIDLAILEAQKSLAARASQNPAMSKLAQLYLHRGRLEDALQTANRMKENALEGAEAVLLQIYLQAGDGDKVLEQANNIPKDQRAHSYYKGWGHLLNGNHADALQALTRIDVASQVGFDLYLAVICIQHYLKETGPLNLPLKTGWGHHPDKLVYFINGSIHASERNDWQKAMDSWRASERLFKNFYFDGISIDELKRHTTDEELRNTSIGLLYYANNIHRKAHMVFERQLSKSKSSIWSNYFLAQVYMKTGEPHKAIAHLKTVVDCAPRFYAALALLGETERMTGSTADAYAHLARAIAVRKEPDLLLSVAQMSEDNGSYEKAEEYYRLLIEAYPEIFLGYNHLAYLYAKIEKNLDLASELAQKADMLAPNNPLVLDTLGWVYFRQRDYDSALMHLHNAEKIADEIPVILYHLGVVYHKKGLDLKAVEYLEKALSISDSFREAEPAKELLREIKK